MQVLFGPEQDALHVDPAAPGAYEWWYFDALSDDEKWALVVIFFLGAPMSPYYKAVANGGKSDARDWCGVFVSLHEKVEPPTVTARWRERAYAYNLYRDGEFSAERPAVAVGGSRMDAAAGADGAWTWTLDVREPGLWRGRTEARLTFTTFGAPPDLPPLGTSAAHNWVCVAPACRATGSVTLPTGRSVAFAGNGYHDHNFGCLPFADTEIWYWGRASVGTQAVVFYHREPPEGPADSLLVLPGAPILATRDVRFSLDEPQWSPYGLRHARRLDLRAGASCATGTSCATGANRVLVEMEDRGGALSEGPFYRRLPLTLRLEGPALEMRSVIGIGEVFRPAKLCGPVASRAIWSRIRRRKT